MTILFIIISFTILFMSIIIVDDIEENNLWFDNDEK